MEVTSVIYVCSMLTQWEKMYTSMCTLEQAWSGCGGASGNFKVILEVCLQQFGEVHFVKKMLDGALFKKEVNHS